MAGPLVWTVDEGGECVVITVRGRLDPGGAPRLRTALLKRLAEQPGALLVDLSAMELSADGALAVFGVVARQAARWPGTPIRFCGPSPHVAELLGRGDHGSAAVSAGVEQGRLEAAAVAVAAPSLGDELLPVAGAARHARNLITEACLAWELPDLVGPACLVVSELVANAVEHAGTMMTVQVARRTRHVHVAVRDGSPAEPMISRESGLTERGRGLMLVEAVSVRWGWLPTDDGKVVWASLCEQAA